MVEGGLSKVLPFRETIGVTVIHLVEPSQGQVLKHGVDCLEKRPFLPAGEKLPGELGQAGEGQVGAARALGAQALQMVRKQGLRLVRLADRQAQKHLPQEQSGQWCLPAQARQRQGLLREAGIWIALGKDLRFGFWFGRSRVN